MTTTLPTSAPAAGTTQARTPRRWALAGVAAGALGVVSIVGSSLSGAVYERANWGDAEAIADDLFGRAPEILLFHTSTMLSCVLLVVFTAGLHRQLRRRTGPESLVPGVAAGGLALVCVAQLLGAGLTTEFGFAFAAPDGAFVPESVVFFGHWIGTVPWLWGGAGLAALAMAAASFRYGAYPRWVAWTSVALGGLTTLFMVSPMQYMAGLTGPVWLVVVATGLALSRRTDG
jgi:hypothetical protein